jgi:hypothetical protein
MSEEKLAFFLHGRSYLVVSDFSRLGSVFVAGEVLVFERATYSRYDECYMYEFHSRNVGEVKSWFLLRAETSEDCEKYFRKIA